MAPWSFDVVPDDGESVYNEIASVSQFCLRGGGGSKKQENTNFMVSATNCKRGIVDESTKL